MKVPKKSLGYRWQRQSTSATRTRPRTKLLEELAALGAHPVGHSQVDPGRITRRLGADEGVREQL